MFWNKTHATCDGFSKGFLDNHKDLSPSNPCQPPHVPFIDSFRGDGVGGRIAETDSCLVNKKHPSNLSNEYHTFV